MYTFVRTRHSVHLTWVHFIVFQLYLKKVDFNTDFVFFFFFGRAARHVGSSSLTGDLTCVRSSLHWKRRVLTTGLPGKSHRKLILKISLRLPW